MEREKKCNCNLLGGCPKCRLTPKPEPVAWAPDEKLKKYCPCGFPQSFPIPHEHDQTEREKQIIPYYESLIRQSYVEVAKETFQKVRMLLDGKTIAVAFDFALSGDDVAWVYHQDWVRKEIIRLKSYIRENGYGFQDSQAARDNGWVKLDKDQSLPENPNKGLNIDIDKFPKKTWDVAHSVGWRDGYQAGMEDLVDNANFRKIKQEGK